MTKIVFHHPDGQVEAIYDGCRPAPGSRDGLIEAVVPSDLKVTRDMRVTVKDGVVTAVEDNPNPVQPQRILEPSTEAVILEAAKAAGLTLDLEAARERLKAR